MNTMKLLHLNCKIITLVVILLMFIIYYHNSSKSIGNLNKHFNQTKTVKNFTWISKTDIASSKRIRRFLIFQGGGVVKLVFGTSFPIIMADKKRSLNYFYNFQIQYSPPTIPLYWWSYYNTTTFMARSNKRKRSKHTALIPIDKSRILIYNLIEATFKRFGNFDNNCLLKIICELARAPLNEDEHLNWDEHEDYGRNMYHKLLNVIFSPLYSNVDERYIRARIAGQNGANCNETFGECRIVDKLFQSYTHLI